MPITDLSQLDLNRTYTYADYLTWQLKERIELLRGRIALMSPIPNLNHQKIVGKLHIYIGHFLLGQTYQAFIAPFDVRLPSSNSQSEAQTYTVVQPDISIVCDPSKLDEKGCVGAPEIVIEVLSPGNTRREMREKYSLYEESGVLEYWLVNPAHPSLTKYIRNEAGVFIGKQPLTDQEDLATELLPGFSVELKKIFG